MYIDEKKVVALGKHVVKQMKENAFTYGEMLYLTSLLNFEIYDQIITSRGAKHGKEKT